MIRVLAVVQARMSSTRLPGKVMAPLLGEPMLFRLLERLSRCRLLDRVVVATSTAVSDDELVAACQAHEVSCMRGSLEDVLARFYEVASSLRPQHVVRITADCPLLDWEVIDRVVQEHLDGGYDYTSNVLPPSFPDGQDVEVMRIECLEQAAQEARLPSEREHVTPFINTQPERFARHNVVRSHDLSALRWTVDNPEDFELIKVIYEALYPVNPAFKTEDVLRLLDSSKEVAALNTHCRRNQGLAQSLEKDKHYLTEVASNGTTI